MEKFKSGFVSIIGRTNVGKSTLINSLLGEKVAITANKSQTTRTVIKAIINNKNSQIIFTDTPGIHKPKTKLGTTMNDNAWSTIPEVDIILFIVEATSNGIGKGDQMILEKLKESNKKAILVINKIDLIEKEKLLKLIDLYNKEYNFVATIPICATQNENTNKIITEIEKNLPEGPAYYDVEEYTDQTERQLVEELIREKALRLLDQEVPHGIYVEVEKMKLRKTSKNQDIYDIEATIYVLRKSHKGIVIGKDGSMLKRIGTYARQDIEKMLDTKVNLKLWVKIKEGWQDNDSIVKKFKNE
ncbi:MAG: GTPase Era [Clostridia bacterium]|jgi:GTP-binding protein era|nr:GTPase Era [Clostridiaceae bacterium]